jgi:pimeloyl-ACP methyl ester carboxylesterase
VLLHGGGGHGRVLAALGVAAQHLGCAAVAPDLPGYGHTVVADPGAVTYQDWIDAAAAVVRSEADAGPPVVLVGASIGGRLAIDVAHATGDAVSEVLATCLLDPRLADHRRAATRHRLLGDLGGPRARGSPHVRWTGSGCRSAGSPPSTPSPTTPPWPAPAPPTGSAPAPGCPWGSCAPGSTTSPPTASPRASAPAP